MESALQSKGINLEWYNTTIIQKEETLKMDENNNNNIVHHNNLSMEKDEEHVIGFVIHKKNNNKSWVSKIPLIGSTFNGHHWFVITRIRSVIVQYHPTNNNDEDTTTPFTNTVGNQEDDNPVVYLEKDNWFLMDSQYSNPMDIGSNDNLFQLLQSIEKEGNSIFRASAKLTKV